MSKLITASIELTKLKSAVTTTAKGTKCIMIPLDQQGVKEVNGKVYFNFNIWENDLQDTYGNTHGIVMQKTKEQISAKEKDVYIGNGKLFKKTETTAPQQQNEPEDLNPPITDLPF